VCVGVPTDLNDPEIHSQDCVSLVDKKEAWSALADLFNEDYNTGQPVTGTKCRKYVGYVMNLYDRDGA
jgi:hypothetical protein